MICVGNVGGADLQTTVFPFILNGIKLIGVGTQDTEMSMRMKLWELLSDAWKPENLSSVVKEIGKDQLSDYLAIMYNKKSRGRVLLHHD